MTTSSDDNDDDRTRIAPAPPPHAQKPATLPPVQAGPVPAPAAMGNNVTIGTRINNNYEVKEVLKAGGMGEVYRGVNVFTGDEVAIKVVLPELAEDEKVSLMFMREARTLSQLSDEAIVRYHNFVKDPDIDRYCLIMEFIKGVPLSELTTEQGPITVEAARVLLRRLAIGLEKAHTLEVIHRDLSPDNVMLPDGVVAEAVLIDFGIAKSNVLKEGTMHGQFAGKFKYVSPEQLGHFGGTIGPATDIYGLALLLSAALLGKPLDMGSSIAEAVQARQSIPDLSQLPVELRPLLAYMLEPDPSMRPASMAEVRRLLDQPELLPKKYGRLPKVTTMAGHPTTLQASVLTAAPSLLRPVTGLSSSQTQTSRQTQTAPVHTLIPENEAPKSAAGRTLGLLALVFIAALGAAGYYAWNLGLVDIPFLNPKTAQEQPAEALENPQQAGFLPRLINTREGFLAAFDAGSCTYATRISAGNNAGMVQGFARRAEAFPGLPGSYEEKFGARPNVLDRVISQDQCPALAFARAHQGRSSDPVTISLTTDNVSSGETVQGQVIDPLGRHIWLALVSPQGGVFNLTAQMSGQVGDRRSFRFGLRLPEGVSTANQILVAVAGNEPLISAAAAQSGVQAGELFPRIANELKGGRAGTVVLTYLEITQPPPEPEPELESLDAGAGGEATPPEAGASSP